MPLDDILKDMPASLGRSRPADVVVAGRIGPRAHPVTAR